MPESVHDTSHSLPITEAFSNPDFSILLARVKQRDEAAARTLVERLHPLVAKVVHAHLPRRDDPEDLFQDIYMKVFSKLGQYRDMAAFEHWVARIARNTCFDRLRRQKVRPEWRWSDLSESEQNLFARTADSASTEDEASHANMLVERVLSQLPAQDAWLIRSVDLEEVPFEDICEAMAWKTGAARVRLFRARRKLKKALLELDELPKNL